MTKQEIFKPIYGCPILIGVKKHILQVHFVPTNHIEFRYPEQFLKIIFSSISYILENIMKIYIT